MAIQIGDDIPNVSVYELIDKTPTPIQTEQLFSGKRVVMLALPGAFTPTCSNAHLPGYVVEFDALKGKGIDAVYCTSVNDAWVMDAWQSQQNADNIRMLADGSADFCEALGLDIDLTERGMGIRSRRYAMVINDGQLEWLGLDEPGQFQHSSVESVLQFLTK